MANKKIVYDFGSNNGDDIPYYLLKSDLVVAVEANPDLSSRIETKFAKEIKNGKLIVENIVLTTDAHVGSVPFFIHKEHHVLSQFPPPLESNRSQFRQIALRAKTVQEILAQHGQPHYIKIDLEGYDAEVLRNLFDQQIFPDYISAEYHGFDVFCLMVLMGKYNAFKLVDGSSVVSRYANHSIVSDFGNVSHSFPNHSAGPFGNDISGDWMTKENFIRVLSFIGLGWRDIHASRIDAPNPNYAPTVHYEIREGMKY